MPASPLTADFDSYIKNVRATQAYILEPAEVTYRGGLLQLNASGNVLAAAGGTALKIVGRKSNDSPDGLKVVAEEGDIFLDLDPDNPPVQADVGKTVYATSDHQVGNVAGANAKAGTLIALQDGGALVRCTLETT